MIEKIRAFLEGDGGKITAVAVLLVGLVVAFFSFRSNLTNDIARTSARRTYVCGETGKPFAHTLTVGETAPVKSPHSGKKTGYPGVECYWTPDGRIKSEPTWLLLNSTLGKPGPTFCPDCDRLVTPDSTLPVPGETPPPLRSQYKPPAR